ncbi:MAG: transposase, partial [Candidatus Poribacteria bacterium]|nr:transposase [Candidatus Poribacteria bacterium]
MTKPTRVDYCQYLLSTPINYTLTHFAAHSETFSHDQINRYLAKDRLKPRCIWEEVKADVVQMPDGYIIFDDTTIEKKHAAQIALAKHQYSGNARKVVNGIGIGTCVYVNPTLDWSWLIDYRIYDKQGEGKTKLDHVEDMLGGLVDVRSVAFSTVFMDSWYASKRLLLYIESLKKTYYCPMKSNRLVDEKKSKKPYQRIAALHWT